MTADPITCAKKAVGSINSDSTVAKILPDDYRVTCTIDVYNFTNRALKNPQIQLENGDFFEAPISIAPGTKTKVLTHKKTLSFYGIEGTLSWDFGDETSRIIAMFSAPFNFNHYSNTLAVGLTKGGKTVANDKELFEKMYDQKNIDGLSMKIAEYYSGSRWVTVSNKEIIVTGMMDTDHEAEVTVYVIPKTRNMVANNVADFFKKIDAW